MPDLLYRAPDVRLPLDVGTVLFDMDGVLVDVSGSYLKAVEATFEHFAGRSLAPGTVEAYKARSGFNDDWHLTQTLLREAGHVTPFEDVVTVFQHIYQGDAWDGLIAEEPILVETAMLERIAGRASTALATGRPEDEAQWTLERCGWTAFFPVVIGMHTQAGRGKPDPFPLLAALEALGETAAPPERTLYVGDRVDDMQAARAAGCYAVGVVPPHLEAGLHVRAMAAAGAHVVLADVNALPDLIG